MARSKFRRSFQVETLEGRQLLSTVAGPTSQEQYMLQLLNEARTNPAEAAQMLTTNLTPDLQATLQYYGVNIQATAAKIASATPQPPLAWNADLAASALGQSQYQANTQVQTHTGVGGSNSQQRMQQAGYTNIASSAENAFAYSTSVEEAMQAFLIDWGVPSDGHRINIQQPGVSAQNANRDVGIGIVQTNNSNFGPLVITQDFASQNNEQAQVVGVAYNDNAGTGFYQPGAGQAGVQIDVVNSQTGQVTSTQTWSAGGYELPLAPGQYTIVASLNDNVIQTSKLTVGNVNVEQDFILTNAWQGGTRENAIAAAQPQPPAPPVIAIPQPTATQPNFAVGVIPAPTTSQPASSPMLSGWSLWSVSIS